MFLARNERFQTRVTGTTFRPRPHALGANADTPKQSAGSQKIALTDGRHAAMLPLARLELRAMSALSLQHAAKQTSRRGYNGALTYLKHCGHF